MEFPQERADTALRRPPAVYLVGKGGAPAQQLMRDFLKAQACDPIRFAGDVTHGEMEKWRNGELEDFHRNRDLPLDPAKQVDPGAWRRSSDSLLHEGFTRQS